MNAHEYIWHPLDVLDAYKRRTVICWQFVEILRGAAQKHGRLPESERGERVNDWYEQHVPGDCYVGMTDDYPGVPAPVALMLQLLDELEEAQRDLAHKIEEWSEKDAAKRLAGVSPKASNLAAVGAR